MKAPWNYMTTADWLVVISLLIVSLAGLSWVALTPEGTHVLVTSSGQTCFTAPIEQPREVTLDGPLGQTKLVIEDHEVRIVSSPCPRKVCISMSPARQTGDLLACVPNRILVHIDSPADREAPYDLLSH